MSEIPLFVCSSFLAARVERDDLHHRVFPHLEEKVRQEGSSLRVVDLQWGVVSDQLKATDDFLEIVAAELSRSSMIIALLSSDPEPQEDDASRIIRKLLIYCAMANKSSKIFAFVHGPPADLSSRDGDIPIIAKLQSRGIAIDYYREIDALSEMVLYRLWPALVADYLSKIGTVFISYSGRGSDTVRKIVASLKNERFNVWIDETDIRGGHAWRTEIVSAIAKCDAVLFLGNRASISSENCRDELAVARERRKPIVSLFLEPVEISGELELLLSRFQKLTIGDGENYMHISQAIKDVIAGTRTPQS